MSQRKRYARSPRKIIALTLAALLGAGSLFSSAAAASAAPGDLAFGTVTVDSNKNGVVDTGNPVGENDTPLAGATVTLRGTDPNHAGWTTTTAADGSWSFPATADYSASPGPFTVTIDAAGVNGNAYLVPEAASAGVNDFTRVSGQSQQSVSASIPANATEQQLNALVYPTWSTDVIAAAAADGMNGNAIWTGTAPFDANDSEDGFDSGMANNRVRTSDVINHTWSVTVNAETDLNSDANIWFEQELKLEPGAVATFGEMPSSCVAGSKIVAQPSGAELQPRQTPPSGTTSVTLVCNLGLMGDSKGVNLLDTQVFVSADSSNGATFTTNVRTYGATENGVTTARPDGPNEFGPFEITAAPRYDIEKNGKNGGFTYGGFAYREIDGKQVLGKDIYYNVLISTDRKTGVEAFQQPVHFEEALWGQYKGTGQNGADGSVNAGMEWYMVGCSPYDGNARQDQSKSVYGKPGMAVQPGGTPSTLENSVRDSGSCAFARQTPGDLTSNYNVTLTGIDASGATYPSKSVSGAAIAADKYYVASYELVMFVPRAEIDKMTGADDDGNGIAAIWNRVGDFDPKGISGTSSNFGRGVEPGYCAKGPNSDAKDNCDKMPAGGQSNNVAGPVEIVTSPGTWDKQFVDLLQSWGFRTQSVPSNQGHAGAGQVQPGQTFTSRVRVAPETDSPNLELCDVFDNRVLKLSPLGKDLTYQNEQYGGAYAQMAYVEPSKQEIKMGDMPAFQSNFDIKYGHVDLGNDNANSGTFNANDNRWEGDWTSQQAAAGGAGTACGDPKVKFFNDPADVPGGVDAVNVVWAKAKSNYVQPATSSVHLLTGIEQRNTYNGGTHDGDEIPANTISANYGNVKSDTMGDWKANNYVPGAGNTGGKPRAGESPLTTGDRWSLVRAELSVKKWSVEGTVNGQVATGVAADGVTGSAQAGTPVIWHLRPTLTAVSDNPAPVNDVVVTDTLPKGVEYDAAASDAIPGNTAPTSATLNADGTTTLVWDLGTLTPNEPIGPFQVATHVDSFLPNNTSLVNKVNMKAKGIVPVAATHNDTHTVTATQPGSLQVKKSVDQTLDLQDQDQNYTLQVKNFSRNLAINSPTIIDVLPYNGDATNSAGVNRNPASDFEGTTKLAAAPKAFLFDGTTPANGTFYYTTKAPADVPQNLNDDTDPSIWSTTFTSDVTAWKFVSDDALGNVNSGAKSGLQFKFKMNQEGNEAGDRYVNRFTAFSPTLMNNGKYQLITSNQVMVRVVGFSLGDLIWFDTDNNGKFTAGTDTAAPEGVKVEVYSAADDKIVKGGSVTTNADGRWVVNDLPKGDYYAVIPASEFVKGGPLEGWIAQTKGYVADPNNDDNEQADHNGATQANGSVKTGSITLSAKVDGSKITGEEPLGDNTGSLTVTPGTTDDFTNFTLDMALRAVPGYEFTKTADPKSGTAVQAGDTITYTITGENTGATKLDTVIADDLTKVLDFSTIKDAPTATVDGAPADPAVTLNGNGLSWKGVLKPKQKITIVYSVTVNEGHEGKTLENHASSTATPPHDPPITPPDVVTKHPIPGYEFTKTADPKSGTAVAPGSEVTYTLTGTNTGATALDPVVITDDLSKVLNNAKMTTAPVAKINGADASVQPAVNGTELSWNSKLKAGETVVITYTVTLNDDAAGVLIENKANSSATPPGLPPIAPPEVVTEHPTPKYEFTKSSNPTSGTAVNPGQTIEYTLTGTNSGKTVLDPAVITDDLSKVLNNAALTVDPVATINGVDAAAQPEVNGTTLSWEGKLEIGETVTITYTVTLNDDAEGVIVQNRAGSSATPPGLPPITPPEVETWHPTPGYTFMKAADPVSGSAVTSGDVITYTLTGTNAGKTVLDPVTVEDDLSGVLEFASIEAAPTAKIVSEGKSRDADSQPTLKGSALDWNGSLEIGEQIVITYKVKVKAGFEGKTLHNRASSTATPPGLPPVTPPEVETEHPIPGFEVAKSSDPVSGSKVRAGQTVSYTVTGTNTGATELDPVVITDDLSKVLNHSAMSGEPKAVIINADGKEAAAKAPKLSGTTLTWTGKLAIGERVELRYAVKVDADAANVKIRNVVVGEATPPGLPPITPPPVETEHEVPAGLPVTGGTLAGGLLALALLLTLGGSAVMLSRRRHQ